MFLQNLDNDKLPEPFLPPKSQLSKRLSPPLLLVQATFFACGGLAVGLYMSHKFGDGGTLSRFVKDWTFLSRGGHSQTLLPALDFTASSSLPPSVSAVQPPADESKRFAVSGDKCVTKRFVFDAAKIAALKAKASASTGQWRRRPTRTEAITALIWRCAMSAARRTNKGLPLRFETKTMELQDLVSLLRKGIEGFDEGEAKRLGGDHGDAAVEIFKSWKERKDLSIRDDLKLVTCTSALDFGFYEIDFGWGKPIWVSLDSGSSLNNFIMLTRTRDGDGVEAWVTLSEEDMTVFELDPELPSFASLSNLRESLLLESHRRRLSKL
ncbi:hypothetical protein FNV43_RR20416 [Rhamnella rubrinervis]|uniref:Uncharacterized protein n=1 Tax=Rhamnella rubrinervis TaxID=2594499 RepID=A0A8K0DUS3_9ROSA|nr:hypothetical protein FNV43_RR20416 [Rhamnella rubrinervis]